MGSRNVRRSAITKKTCEQKLRECLTRRRNFNSKVADLTIGFVFAHREYSKHARNLAIEKYNENLPSGAKKANVENFTKIDFDTERMKKSFESIGVPYDMLNDIITAIKVGDDAAHRFNHKNDFANLSEIERGMQRVRAERTAKDAFRKISRLWKSHLHKIAKTTRRSPYHVMLSS